MATYKFVNAEDIADGSGEYDLHDEVNTFLRERQSVGMGMPPVEIRSDIRARRAGSELKAARLTPRNVGIVVRVKDSTHANTMDRVRALIKYVAGTRGREAARFGHLRVTAAGDSEKYLRCICSVAPKDYGNAVTDKIVDVPLGFHAPHPNWYDPTEQTGSITIGVGGSGKWPITWPHTWPLDGFTGSATIANDGDVETRSLLWSVPGPTTSPGLSNDTIGKYVKLTDLTVAAGDTLKVRMGWRPDGVTEHKAVVENSSGLETNVLGFLDTGSEFFHLEPGNNVLTASQDSPQSGTVHSLAWYEEYLSV